MPFRRAHVAAVLLMLPLFVFFPGSIHAQDRNPQEEAEALTDKFTGLLNDAGTVRKIDPDLLHPAFLEGPPCPLVPFVEADVCRNLNQADRHDYAVAVINVMWLIYEHQLSLATPAWLRAPGGDDVEDLLPPEVQPLMSRLQGRARTVEAFRQTYAATKEAEAILLARSSARTDSERTNRPVNPRK